MNERIQELWNQAANASAACPSGQNNSWETQAIFMEKFAELIVQECANLDFSDVDYISIEGEDQVRKIIKEHFGVEE